VQQLHAQLVLQLRDAATHRRLRQPQRFGGFGVDDRIGAARLEGDLFGVGRRTADRCPAVVAGVGRIEQRSLPPKGRHHILHDLLGHG